MPGRFFLRIICMSRRIDGSAPMRKAARRTRRTHLNATRGRDTRADAQACTCKANAPSSTMPLRHVAMLNSQGGNLTFKCAANRNQVRCTDAALSRTYNFRMQCEFSRYRRAIRATSSRSLLPIKEHISKCL